MVKKILLPTDFSEGSKNALPYAVELTKQYNASLYMIHVIYDINQASGLHVPHVNLDQLYSEIESVAKKELERFGLEELRGMNVQREVLRGVPYEEIVKYAEKNQIDLIVIGTHGRKGLEKIFFGSTAEQVVRKAPCAVLTVRLPKKSS
ncbi:MAG: universal stress protein [Thermodesulfovibrionales bacterium]